jgi:adenylate cyclase
MKISDFLRELRRRFVFRAAGAYLVTAWILLQLGTIVFPALHAPSWCESVLLGFLVLGFPVAVVLAWAFEVTPEGVRRTRPAVATGEAPAGPEDGLPLGPPRRTGVGSRRAVAAMLGVILLGLGAWAYLHRARPVASPSIASAAVLPFVDLSPGHDQAYFSDGLTDELITTLSEVHGLRVAARTSSFQFKGQNPDVHDVGTRLDVQAVLEGSVRKSGDRLRVSAQLIDVKNGFQLWADSYDRKLADVFAVQEDLARSIVSALRVHLAPARDSALATPPTGDLTAYDLYLKGLFAWNQRTGPSIQEAVRYLEQAVARDSSFTRAWAALAEADLLLAPFAGGSPTAAAASWEKARTAAERALALDSTSAEAYTALAYGYMIYGFDWKDAEANFRRAIAANPNYAVGHHWYGDFLAGRGRLDESLAQMDRAHQLDPLAQQIGIERGWVMYLMGRSGQAEAAIRQVLALDPNYAQAPYRLGLVEIQEHRYDDAVRDIRRGIDLGTFQPYGASGLAYAYGASGDPQAALRVVRDLESRYGKELIPAFSIAAGYAGLGDVKRGVEWLQRAVDERDVYLPENFFDPVLDPLREAPGFDRVLSDMGLEPGAGMPWVKERRGGRAPRAGSGPARALPDTGGPNG